MGAWMSLFLFNDKQKMHEPPPYVSTVFGKLNKKKPKQTKNQLVHKFDIAENGLALFLFPVIYIYIYTYIHIYLDILIFTLIPWFLFALFSHLKECFSLAKIPLHVFHRRSRGFCYFEMSSVGCCLFCSGFNVINLVCLASVCQHFNEPGNKIYRTKQGCWTPVCRESGTNFVLGPIWW